MRLSDKEITDREEIDVILRSAKVVHLAMVDEGEPYVVPVFFGYADGSLSFHSAREGRKIDILRRDPRVCFNVVADYEVISGDAACSFGARYRSVTGKGNAIFIEEPDEKRIALDHLMSKFASGGLTYKDAALDRIAVIRVDIEDMAGKRSEG